MRIARIAFALAAVAATPLSAAEPGPWTALFDGKSLEGWKIIEGADFAARGAVKVEDGAIVMGEGAPMTGIAWQGEVPRDDYEIELEGMRRSGSDFFCGLTFPVDMAQCTWINGGWGGSVVGLSNVDDMNASENETTRGIHFENGRWYKLRLRVTRERIQAWIDEVSVFDLARANRRFSIWWEQRPLTPLGIGTWYTGAALRNIRLRSLDGAERETRPLAGTWRFRLDPTKVGETEKWYNLVLPDRIRLPGSTDEGGYGTKTTERIPWRLNRLVEYTGPAWYQRDIEIPEGWKGKRILLHLERCHWETHVWIDDREIGMQDSLCVPHVHDITAVASPGSHRLTIRVDNTMKVNVGVNAHSITEETQTNWNGIVGRMRLEATDAVWIRDVQVFPDVAGRRAQVRIAIGNATGARAEGTLALRARGFNAERTHEPPVATVPFAAPGAETTIEATLALGDGALLWDEFSPALYRLTASIEGEAGAARIRDARGVDFGLREFKAKGTQFAINGRPTFLRGTLECCIFPLTGYPAMDIESWARNIRVAKSYGLNHFRFHSWCPPEAAFEAADRLGFTFHVETPVWTTLGTDPKVDTFVYAEGDRILAAYGNHPSFCMLAVGNEPSGNHIPFLKKIVRYWQGKDPRRVYTSCAGWPVIPESDYHSTPDPRIQAWGAGLRSRVNAQPLSTDIDYADWVAKYEAPIVSHEIGQWCVYPNFDEISKYTGVLRARNFEVARDMLAAHHMLDQARDFLIASGKLQALLYKEDIEAALRTKGFGGFQLLDLHDFPGQGTALVGVLDAFWDAKGYIEPRTHRRYCSETVPLLRMKKVIFTRDETFAASAEIAHFGSAPLADAQAAWSIAGPDRKEIAAGEWPARTIPIGNGIPLGTIEWPLASAPAPAKLVVSVAIKGTSYENSWDIGVYPERVDTATPAGITIAEALDDAAVASLRAGGKVFLMPRLASVKSNVPAGFSSIFWNTAWTRGQPPHTLGILCDPKAPALAKFPTEYHSSWQWWDIVSKSRALVLDAFPSSSRPLVQVIDDWNTNRKLGIVVEANVEGGKLLLASIDLRTDIEKRPVARQLLASLLAYAASDAFAPRDTVPIETLRGLFKTPSLLSTARIVRTDSEQLGYEATNAIDGDPATIWHTAWEPEKPDYPHEFVIELPRALTIRGLRYTPRQDMKNGWISAYAVYVSDDGKIWGKPAAEGTFALDKSEKAIGFADPRRGRYIRFVALRGIEGQRFASVAEVEIDAAE